MFVPWMWPLSKENARGSFGGLRFFGPKSFVEDCLNAVNEYLPKYDEALAAAIIKSTKSIFFYYEDKGQLSFPNAGLYSIPERIAKYGPEGICQYLVFRYLQTRGVGTSLADVLRIDPQKQRETMIGIRKDMAHWLIKAKYPGRWLACYKSEQLNNSV